MGKSTISTGPFSIAMLVHQRVAQIHLLNNILNDTQHMGKMIKKKKRSNTFDQDFVWGDISYAWMLVLDHVFSAGPVTLL